jgi:hypothetical protein
VETQPPIVCGGQGVGQKEGTCHICRDEVEHMKQHCAATPINVTHSFLVDRSLQVINMSSQRVTVTLKFIDVGGGISGIFKFHSTYSQC